MYHSLSLGHPRLQTGAALVVTARQKEHAFATGGRKVCPFGTCARPHPSHPPLRPISPMESAIQDVRCAVSEQTARRFDRRAIFSVATARLDKVRFAMSSTVLLGLLFLPLDNTSTICRRKHPGPAFDEISKSFLSFGSPRLIQTMRNPTIIIGMLFQFQFLESDRVSTLPSVALVCLHQ